MTKFTQALNKLLLQVVGEVVLLAEEDYASLTDRYGQVTDELVCIAGIEQVVDNVHSRILSTNDRGELVMIEGVESSAKL